MPVDSDRRVSGGLELVRLSAKGGVVVEVSSVTGSLQASGSTFASGFFVRDVAAGSDFEGNRELSHGEYLDSLEAQAPVLDYRPSHLAAANLPLVFASTFRPALPEIWATYEFARWVAGDIHGMGKLMMANGALLRFAFPAHLFDVMGVELNWLVSGQFRPESDERFNFWRTLSYRKPYGTLMNTDFSAFDHSITATASGTNLMLSDIIPAQGVRLFRRVP